jgi:glycosyltransferase involved in cell wall biosynthesis
LLEHLRGLGAAAPLLIPNAAPPPRVKAWPSRRAASVLYVGAVEAWFDFALVDALARAMPEAAIEIIGARGATPPAGLPRNVVFLGERSHAHAAKAMMQARVGIIPFKRGALIAAVNPVKAYEYLAAGLPVVMTPMGGEELAGAPGVTVAENPDAFVAAVKAAFGASNEDRRGYAAWAEANTWAARAQVILDRLAQL